MQEMSSSVFNGGGWRPLLLFLLLLVLLIRSYPFYSRIEFDKFMYKITFESLARKGGIMNGGRERRRFSFV
jgi:hypothetical protein